MRIGIDARELCGRSTGVGRYLGGLIKEWQADGRGHEFVLYAPGVISLPLDARRFATRTVRGGAGSWWEQVEMPRTVRGDHLDVWFAPAYTAPLMLPLPFVVAIHDLSFVAHPEWFRLREGIRRRWLVRQAAGKAAAVITISQFSRQELIERLHVPDARIHVIPPGIGGSWDLGTGFRANVVTQSIGGSQSSPPSAHLAQPGARVLYVGSIFTRRHVVDLIRALAAIARVRTDVSLDIVGDNRSYPREDLRATSAAEGVADRVRVHDYVSDEQLRDLYARAGAFAFLSEYEGLGLTPLEALAAGVPPVLLDTAVARESCGAAAVYVAAPTLPAITAGLQAALFDAAERARIRAAAPAQLAKFSWRRAAADTLTVLERAAR